MKKSNYISHINHIVLADNLKEAKEIIGFPAGSIKYLGVHKYSKGKGNNFYKFAVPNG